MQTIRTFADARQALEAFYADGLPKKTGLHTLERMRALLEFAGNPQQRLRVVHVAGTSGKTSTAYYAAALLHAAGHRVGLTVSPHVVNMNDRLQIDGQPLDERQFCDDLTRFLRLVERGGFRPTYFEIMMAFALWEFDRLRVDYAVVEVGLGGLLDASNVVERRDKLCIITDIGKDHMHVLGKTLPEIAMHKAGIIQTGNTVFCYRQTDAVTDIFRTQCRQKQADLHILAPGDDVPVATSLPGFQRRNFTLACRAVNWLLASDGYERPSRAGRLQAARIAIPGRMETVQIAGKTVILDGAHNEQKLQALMDGIAERYPGRRVAAVVAFVSKAETSERLRKSMQLMRPYVSYVIATQFGGPQDAPHAGVAADLIGETARASGYDCTTVEPLPRKAFQTALATDADIVVVAGSFYLLNHIRQFALRLSEHAT